MTGLRQRIAAWESQAADCLRMMEQLEEAAELDVERHAYLRGQRDAYLSAIDALAMWLPKPRANPPRGGPGVT